MRGREEASSNIHVYHYTRTSNTRGLSRDRRIEDRMASHTMHSALNRLLRSSRYRPLPTPPIIAYKTSVNAPPRLVSTTGREVHSGCCHDDTGASRSTTRITTGTTLRLALAIVPVLIHDRVCRKLGGRYTGG